MWKVYEPMQTILYGLTLYEWSWVMLIVSAGICFYAASNILFGEYSTSYVYTK